MTVEFGEKNKRDSLTDLGFKNLRAIYWNLHTPALYEESMRRSEGIMAHLGPLVVRTGEHTGRSPNDKFIVKQSPSQDFIYWGDVNRPFQAEDFDRIQQDMLTYIQGKDLFCSRMLCRERPK